MSALQCLGNQIPKIGGILDDYPVSSDSSDQHVCSPIIPWVRLRNWLINLPWFLTAIFSLDLSKLTERLQGKFSSDHMLNFITVSDLQMNFAKQGLVECVQLYQVSIPSDPKYIQILQVFWGPRMWRTHFDIRKASQDAQILQNYKR